MLELDSPADLNRIVMLGPPAQSSEIADMMDGTRLPGRTDHVTVHTSHTLLPLNREVARQTIHFLMHGRFERRASDSYNESSS